MGYSGHCGCGADFVAAEDFYAHITMCSGALPDAGLADADMAALVDYLAAHGPPWTDYVAVRIQANVRPEHAQAYQEVCPLCHAPAGYRCVSKVGRPTSLHTARAALAR